MNLVHALEFVHQLRKTRRLRISRKHCLVYHSQDIGARVQKISNLGRAVLEPHNLATTGHVCPKVAAASLGKLVKNLDSSIHALIFSSNVDK
jgi:hypothetical protein